MSADEEAAALGRTLIEYREAKTRAVALESELRRAAATYRVLADILDRRPDPFPLHRLDDTPDIDAVRARAAEYVIVRDSRARLRQALRDAGVEE